MTCVVGVVQKGEVVIGGDSGAFSNWHMCLRSDEKVFRNSRGFVFGFSGSYRLGQLLRYQFEPPTLYGHNDVMSYMVKEFVPALRELLKNNEVRGEKEISPGSFLVGILGRLFEVEQDLQVGENLDGIAAAGCGREPALGALYALRQSCPDMGAHQLVLMGLKTSEHWNGGVRAPFHVVSSWS
jgi:ATP-dependent protease HslVU (ClpYQ) peptidase subunit